MAEEDAASAARLDAELALLAAIYPGETAFEARARELRFRPSGSLVLRLPDNYLTDTASASSLPEVLSAHDERGADVSGGMRAQIATCAPGEEVLDVLLAGFVEECQQRSARASDANEANDEIAATNDTDTAPCTVVVWLHHLLAQSKRKLALMPTSADAPGDGVAGVTKPGYPGVMVFSGPARAVRAHLAELRAQRWQAFQVRLEMEGSQWTFAHGIGVVEVESMGEVTRAIEGKDARAAFLEAMKIKG